MDRVTTPVRSKNMAAVRGRGNLTTEVKLIRLLRASKIAGWRTQQKIYGRPDLVFHRKKVAIFVDGCFWHGCKAHRTIPKTNRRFWSDKIQRNIRRDKDVGKFLKRKGWVVIRIWEHTLKGKQAYRAVDKIAQYL